MAVVFLSYILLRALYHHDTNRDWVLPASREMFRVLKPNSLMVSFYGWIRVDTLVSAWKQAGFRIVGHLVFARQYASKSAFVGYQHENAYILAKGRPPLPAHPLSDVQTGQYIGNRHHPTEKRVASLKSLVESFTQPGAIVLNPFGGFDVCRSDSCRTPLYRYRVVTGLPRSRLPPLVGVTWHNKGWVTR
jgi:DNA modification methylase